MRKQNNSTQLDFNGILFHGFHKCFTLFSRAFLHVAPDYFFAFVLWLYYFHHLTHVNILTENFLKILNYLYPITRNKNLKLERSFWQRLCSQWLLEFRSIALFLFNCILSLNIIGAIDLLSASQLLSLIDTGMQNLCFFLQIANKFGFIVSKVIILRLNVSELR